MEIFAFGADAEIIQDDVSFSVAVVSGLWLGVDGCLDLGDVSTICAVFLRDALNLSIVQRMI